MVEPPAQRRRSATETGPAGPRQRPPDVRAALVLFFVLAVHVAACAGAAWLMGGQCSRSSGELLSGLALLFAIDAAVLATFTVVVGRMVEPPRSIPDAQRITVARERLANARPVPPDGRAPAPLGWSRPAPRTT